MILIQIRPGVIAAALFALSAAAPALAQPASGSAQAVLDFEKARREAVERKDIPALDAMSAAGLFYVDAHGIERRKQDYLDHIKVEAIQYKSYSLDDASAKVYGDMAVATGIFRFDVVASDHENKGAQLYTAVYVREGGAWKLLIWHPTDLSP